MTDNIIQLYPFDSLSDYDKVAFQIECIPTSISLMYMLDTEQDERLSELMQPVVEHLLQCQKENYDE